MDLVEVLREIAFSKVKPDLILLLSLVNIPSVNASLFFKVLFEKRKSKLFFYFPKDVFKKNVSSGFILVCFRILLYLRPHIYFLIMCECVWPCYTQ